MNAIKKVLPLLLLLTMGACELELNGDNESTQKTSSADYTDIEAAEAKELIEETENLVIIDVSPYYKDGHIPGAVNYPVSSGALDEAIPDIDLSSTFLVYCHADSPAITAAKKLLTAGATKVYRLIGNYQAWVDAGYEIETD